MEDECTIKVYPTSFEAWDIGFPMFKINTDDGECANVRIDIGVTVESWKEISDKILECLVAMRLGENADD